MPQRSLVGYVVLVFILKFIMQTMYTQEAKTFLWKTNKASLNALQVVPSRTTK